MIPAAEPAAAAEPVSPKGGVHAALPVPAPAPSAQRDHLTTTPVVLPVECTAKGKNLQLLKIEIMSHETHKKLAACQLQNHHRTITIVGCSFAI